MVREFLDGRTVMKIAPRGVMIFTTTLDLHGFFGYLGGQMTMLGRVCSVAALVSLVLPVVGCPPDGPPYFINGTATLPACTEAPSFDLGGLRLSDTGTVTITGAGCKNTTVGETFQSCSLTWVVVAVDGNDIEFFVDNEYTVLGRLCGDQLHLEGGWWLPVVDGDFGCTYEEDSADEVGIQTGGNTLTINNLDDISGVLLVEGSCTAEYNVSFRSF